jgi:hypothetical protein
VVDVVADERFLMLPDKTAWDIFDGVLTFWTDWPRAHQNMHAHRVSVGVMEGQGYG